MPTGGFRKLYGPDGPGGYYREHGGDYANPHEPAVAACIAHVARAWSREVRPDGIDLSCVLDLAAGGGEATLVLLRERPECVVDAIDPFTHALYQQRTGRPCRAVAFEQIARAEVELGAFTCIIASCALHLASDSYLPGLCIALAQATRDLVVLTPMTRPRIREEWGWRLVEATSREAEGKSLRLRWYRAGE
jgi:hypothetical protein